MLMISTVAAAREPAATVARQPCGRRVLLGMSVCLSSSFPCAGLTLKRGFMVRGTLHDERSPRLPLQKKLRRRSSSYIARSDWLMQQGRIALQWRSATFCGQLSGLALLSAHHCSWMGVIISSPQQAAAYYWNFWLGSVLVSEPKACDLTA